LAESAHAGKIFRRLTVEVSASAILRPMWLKVGLGDLRFKKNGRDRTQEPRAVRIWGDASRIVRKDTMLQGGMLVNARPREAGHILTDVLPVLFEQELAHCDNRMGFLWRTPPNPIVLNA
jgi:hypothetical protein